MIGPDFEGKQDLLLLENATKALVNIQSFFSLNYENFENYKIFRKIPAFGENFTFE